MKREIYIVGMPGTCGGALTEIANFLDLARSHDVSVTLCAHDLRNQIAIDFAQSIGCKIRRFDNYKIFKNKIVAAWNNGKFLTRLPSIIDEGKPRCVVYFNCMLMAHRIELLCHHVGWINYHGFVSDYQRKVLIPQLDRMGPTNEFEGYIPYFNPDNDLQRIKFEYRKPVDVNEFVVGRISRDDPRKFADDTWKIFGDVDTGPLHKRVLVAGFGYRTRPVLGNPPEGMNATLLEADEMPVAWIYRQLHCIIHKPGSSGESYCRIVPECYAAGVPFVGSRDFAFPELVVHGETGFLCESSEEMSACASMLARDEPLRERIIRNGYEHLKANMADAEKCWLPWERLFREFE